jgi:hypothetical protein
LFANNSALEEGAAVFAYSGNTSSFLQITNSTFAGNSAARGGGLSITDAVKASVVNSVFWGNTAPQGPQMAATEDGGSHPTQLSVSFSDVQGGSSAIYVSGLTPTWGLGNLDLDPLFSDADYRLAAGSPCNDAGNNLALQPDYADIDGDGNTTEPVPLDLDLTIRVADDPLAPDVGNGTAPFVDLGAYER